jgi:S-DNA-T family DNA segregation ATPase FtsK/SpoIIIE
MAKTAKPIQPHTGREVAGVMLLALALVVYLALVGHQGGALGGALARGVRHLVGWEAWWAPALVGAAGVLRLLNRPSLSADTRGGALLALSLLADVLTGLLAPASAGLIGRFLAHGLVGLVGVAGGLVVVLALLVVTLLVGTGGSLLSGLRLGGQAVAALAAAMGRGGRGLVGWVFPEEEEHPADLSVRVVTLPGPEPEADPIRDPEPRPETVPETVAGTTTPKVRTPRRPISVAHPDAVSYTPPGLELLSDPRALPSTRGRRVRPAHERGEVLVETLRQFGIEVRLAEVSQGPTVTRFELVPPPGVKVSKIVNLADDIALSLAATGVRIEAPIPGKSAIGIEVPNEEIATVWLREVLESPAFHDAPSPLTVALGKDIAGRPVTAPLDGMPHLLVAGATGSGKSVLINVLILSLLFRAGPAQVRLLLIDPKVVELSGFNGIPHLLTPVVTDPKKASQALRWAVREMERRYQLFAQAGVRDVTRYNQMAEERLPYIVVVIDELADLMMVAPVEVEESIARLAQMARAAGLHLVVATQRPSVDVITGTIKANIPSRIAFAVSSQVDSRTILDAAGAEKLMGRGDMLFHPVGAPKPVRIQGALVQEAEIEGVVAALRASTPPEGEALEFSDSEGGSDVLPETDSLFEDAVRIVVESRQASASMLQRRLRVGYTRAARLVDAMAERGFVSPADGARAREVYLTPEQFHRLFQAGPGRSESE